jgi:hypothetical protein
VMFIVISHIKGKDIENAIIRIRLGTLHTGDQTRDPVKQIRWSMLCYIRALGVVCEIKRGSLPGSLAAL